jgi:putative redox protein
VKIALSWKGDERFSAADESGAVLALDGDRRDGYSPMQALLASLGGCMAIDVSLILKKMRARVDGLGVELEGERGEEPPRYFRAVRMVFVVTGDVDVERVEHAVKLSRERYCSVLHTLRPDLELTTTVLTK